MSFGIVATVGSAILGAGATIYAANSANNSTNAAAAASGQANAANIALAQEQRARNEALFAQYLGDEARARAYLDALEFGTATYNPNATGLSGSMSGFELENYLRERFPQQAAEWDGWERAGNSATNGHRTLWGNFQGYLQAQHRAALQQAMADLATQQESEQPGAETITREQVMAMLQGTPLAQYAAQDFAARGDLNDEYLSGAYSLADDEYGDVTGQAEANLAQRLGLEEDSYAAWLPMSQQAERDAINLNFSRGGVNGLIGETRRGVGETTQNAAMERNLRLMQGRQAAYSPYYDDMMDATALRGGRRQGAYDTYSGRRAANYDTFSGDRTAAYDDFRGYLTDTANRGYGARANIASGGQAFVDAATSANNRNAAAQSEAAYRRGEISQTLAGDMARIAGDAWGAIRNRKTGSSSSGSSGSAYDRS